MMLECIRDTEETMRIFGFVLFGFVLGFVGVYVATVAALFAYAELNDIVDRDGGMSMGIIFVIGPLVGFVGGAVASLVTALLMRRRARLVAEGARPPLRGWPLGLRMALCGLALGLGIYLIMCGVYWLLAPMSFESNEIAVIVLNIPVVAGIVAAILGAWIAMRRSTAQT
jgi:hypothetical protein